jgi:hypothetical protein
VNSIFLSGLSDIWIKCNRFSEDLLYFENWIMVTFYDEQGHASLSHNDALTGMFYARSFCIKCRLFLETERKWWKQWRILFHSESGSNKMGNSFPFAYRPIHNSVIRNFLLTARYCFTASLFSTRFLCIPSFLFSGVVQDDSDLSFWKGYDFLRDLSFISLYNRNNAVLQQWILSVYFILRVTSGSRDSVVGIATGYGLDDRGVGVRVPVG